MLLIFTVSFLLEPFGVQLKILNIDKTASKIELGRILSIFIHSLINSKCNKLPESGPPVIKHTSFQLITVMMYVPPHYCAVKREVTMAYSLDSHKSMDTQHQFGHLTGADPENSERGGRGTCQPRRYYIF